MEPSNEELAWMAGFFDGEGCINIHFSNKNGCTTLRAGVSQKFPEPLERIQLLMGGNLYKDRAGYVLVFNGKKAEAFLASILPWLFVKRTQAEVALGAIGAAKDVRREVMGELVRLKRKGA
jgi:hypothetical protein